MPMSTIFPLRQQRRVYCAGPLFNESERREMLEIAHELRRSGFEPFVPHADGMEFARVEPYLAGQGYDRAAAGRLLHEAIFALDVYQVMVACGSLVLNMNGRVPDEGAVAETAIAWSLGKPLVIFKADARSKIAGRDNPLLAGLTGFETVTRIDEIGAALAARQAALDIDPEFRFNCPPHLRRTLSAGASLWQLLETLGTDRSDEPVAAAVIELFGAPSAAREPLPAP